MLLDREVLCAGLADVGSALLVLAVVVLGADAGVRVRWLVVVRAAVGVETVGLFHDVVDGSALVSGTYNIVEMLRNYLL